jgi:hypothetical protein
MPIDYGWALANRAALMPTRAQTERSVAVVKPPEAAERLLGLARITVAQDDQAAAWDLLGRTLLRSIVAPGTVSSSALSASRTCSVLLAGIASLRF